MHTYHIIVPSIITIVLFLCIIINGIEIRNLKNRLAIYKKALEEWESDDIIIGGWYSGFCEYFRYKYIHYNLLKELIAQRERSGKGFHYIPGGYHKAGRIKRVEALKRAIKLTEEKLNKL